MKIGFLLAAIVVSVFAGQASAAKTSFTSVKAAPDEACDAARAGADQKVEANCRNLGGLKESRQENRKSGKSGSKFSAEVKITYFCDK